MTIVPKEKAEAFLWAVQTAVMTNASSIRRGDGERDKVAEYSGSGVFIVMDEAVRAAGLIPEEKDAAEAANEFIRFWYDRDDQDRSPGWFQRYGMESASYSHMTKAQQFLWIVQSVIVCDQENQAHADPEGDHPKRYDPDRCLKAIRAAVLSADHIPDRLDVTDAANEFVAHFAMRERKKAPSWARSLE